MFEDMRCVITARFFKREKCFGPGIAELLEGIEELKSLRAAAMRMGMAYSKAWRIIHENRGCAAASLAGRGRKLVNKLETDMLMY